MKKVSGPSPPKAVALARQEQLEPGPWMWVFSPTFIASAWSVAPMTYGSTTANMFFSSISIIRSIRLISSCIVLSSKGYPHADQNVLEGLNLILYLLHSLTIDWTSSVLPGRRTASPLGVYTR